MVSVYHSTGTSPALIITLTQAPRTPRPCAEIALALLRAYVQAPAGRVAGRWTLLLKAQYVEVKIGDSYGYGARVTGMVLGLRV